MAAQVSANQHNRYTSSLAWQYLLPAIAAIFTISSGSVADAATPTETPAGVPSTILPTDTLPVPFVGPDFSLAQKMQLKMLELLPEKMYFNAAVESSFRDETNPFQYPTRANYLKHFAPPPPVFRTLLPLQQLNVLHQASNANINNVVFRVLPNITIGWAFTPRTRMYGNYFMIRDTLFHSSSIDTTVQSLAYGIQHDFPLGKRGNWQTDFQVRNLYQSRLTPLYDFLPNTTVSYVLTPRTVVFFNALLQLRGGRYFQSPTKEIDPFYSFGGVYQKNSWVFSTNATFLQNFRQLFGGNAIIPQNNFSWILDFEIAKRLFPKVPGLQAFVRAEPIYNMASRDTPGLSGVDFRIFWGLRMAMGKAPLNQALEQIRQQVNELNEQHLKSVPPAENPPSEPEQQNQPPANKPAAYMPGDETVQPMHDSLSTVIPISEIEADHLVSLSSLHTAKNADETEALVQ